MRVQVLLAVSVIAVVASSSAMAKPVINTPIPTTVFNQEDLRRAGVSSLEGLFVGGGASGFSAGVVTVNGSVGYNFDSFGGVGGTEIYTGVEGSFGLQLPTSRFETWITGKAGPEISPGTWGYGRFGLGVINSTPVWSAGIGFETKIQGPWSAFGEFLVRGGVGSGLSEFGVGGGLHYYLDTEAPSQATNFSTGMKGWPDVFNAQSHSFYVGASVGFVPSKSTIIPSVDFGVNCMHAADLELGLRGRVGVQLSSSHAFELWGGGQVGFNLNDQAKLYGFGELGTIGGGLYNSIGAGGEYQVGRGWGLYGEGFTRGSLGTATEFGARLGLRHYFESIDTGH